MAPRIMYIEPKGGVPSGVPRDFRGGTARIGRVRFSQTGKMIYYGDRSLKSLRGTGYKANYFDPDTGEEFWVSGCKVAGGDRLYPGIIEIDDDVRIEYWTDIRKLPSRSQERSIRCNGSYRR